MVAQNTMDSSQRAFKFLERQIARLLTQDTITPEEIVMVLEVFESMSDEELDRTPGSRMLFARLANESRGGQGASR